MSRFTTGVIAGGIIGMAAAAAWSMKDSGTRRRIAKRGQRILDKAGDTLHDISGKI